MSDVPLDLAAIRARLATERGPRLWRSLEELVGDPDVRRAMEAEFPDLAQAGTIDRRMLMRLMGASFALGLAACERNEEGSEKPLLSQARNTPSYTPGVPFFFATSLELGGYGRGVLVKAQEGRPIKIEGNPLHPASLGATDVFAQAEVLSLYDPDRSTTPLENSERRSWEDMQRLLAAMRRDLVAQAGRGLHVLMPPVASPTLHRLIEATQRALPGARFYYHAPIDDENARAGAIAAFGRNIDVVYDLTQADAIVTLGGDLFASAPGHIRYAADYQARRREQGRPLPRLFAAESCPSLIGIRADERVILRPSEIERFARDLAAALNADATQPSDDPTATRLALELRRAGSRGLLVPGREQPPAVHALAHAMNARLAAFGTTARAIEPVRPSPLGEIRSLAELAEAIAAGSVSRLIVLSGNPAYDAPADLDLAALIRRVPLSVHLGYHVDETAAACRWHVPQAHALESWGDLRAYDGTLGFCQPATVRLVQSFGQEEMLALLAGEADAGRALVETTWRAAWGDGFAARFAQALEAGVVPDTAFPSIDVALQGVDEIAPAARTTEGVDILFAPDPSLWDGRYANNGWLQELPKPLTKQVWGNAALIAPDTARKLGLTTGDDVDIAVNARTVRAPLLVLPGHAPDTLTLPLGYGRTHAGALGGGVGFDAYAVRTSERPWIARGAITPAGARSAIVTTQHHHALEGRDIIRVVAPDQPPPPPPEPLPSLYPEWRYDGYAWGMAIDLDACIGCNACVVACQAENNVPVVGAEEVARGREMHWLRVDRYFAGDPAEPKTYFQPVPCMHCEKAPCEVVCPVNATVHSSEGLNDMVYNRCVGTRTCSNNCPYKVRRFNFLDYRGTQVAPGADPFNPEVTLRGRGVMEKCTFCVQRIGAARIEARIEDRTIRDGEVVTACQQACPTRAIVFGDINDKASAVTREKESPRNYALLGELNTQPRTTYLARIEAEPDGSGGG